MTTKLTGIRKCILVTLALSLFACSTLGNLGQPEIPDNAQIGLEPGTKKIVGHLQLSDWAEGVSETAYLTVFEGRLAETGESDIRVFFHDDQSARYIGALSDQLQLPGVKTLFINFGSQRCIIGWVSPDTEGQLLFFHIERPEADRTRWMEAVEESTIEKNVFLVPITASDQPELWDFVVMAAVETRESLSRGFEGEGSYYQIETAYSPPLDVSGLYLPISIQE